MMAMLALSPARATDYTYNVDFPLLINATAGFENVTGTIVTTCNSCSLGPSNIVSWSFTIPGPPFSLITSNASDFAQPVQVNGASPFLATPTAITLNPAPGGHGNIIFDDSFPVPGGGYDDAFLLFRAFPYDGASISYFDSSTLQLFQTFSGDLLIGTDLRRIDCVQVGCTLPNPFLDRLERREERRILRDDLAATPVPAALPMFVSGLGALGLLGWRRKRKNAAAIAA
jgi:hypothetical protein